MTRYYETTYTITILSEDEPIDSFVRPTEVGDMITYGDCVGSWKAESKELNDSEIRERLSDLGSDSSFFNLDERPDE